MDRRARAVAIAYRAVAAATATAVAATAAAALAQRRAFRRLPPAKPAGRFAVLVLGYPSRPSGRLHPLQRWRVDIAARTAAAHPGAILVFTGGSRTAGRQSEADAMAADARARYDFPPDRIRLEPTARTTWENVEFSAPLLADVDRIAIASDPLHVVRAYRYLRQRRPEVADRVCAATGYRPLEHPVLELAATAYETMLAIRFGRRAAVRGTPVTQPA